MDLSAKFLALGLVLQWTLLQMSFGLTLVPLRFNFLCSYPLKIDEETMAFVFCGYPLSVGFSFAIGRYLSLQMTIPPQLEKQKFYEFQKYMEDTGMTKLYLNLIDSIVDQDVVDEEVALQLMLKACGSDKEKEVDTGPIKKEISHSKQKIAEAKLYLKEAMLKYLDAIERSTNEDFFIETELRKRTKGLSYNRAACLLKQFGCKTKVHHIRRLRKELGIPPTLVTSAQKSQARRMKFMTASEASFINARLKGKLKLEPDSSTDETPENAVYEGEEEDENAEAEEHGPTIGL